MTERIIQFGSGGFLRSFADVFVHQMNEKGLFNGSVVVVQPTPNGKASLFNEQNGEFHQILRGIENGEVKAECIKVKSISRGVDPFTDYQGYLSLARQPEMRFIISNTTEAGIEYLGTESLTDAPPKSFPAKLTALLYERFKAGLPGFVILACELIDNNGKKLLECVLKYAELWNLGDDFINWLKNDNHFCSTLVDRICTGYPADEAEKIFNDIGTTDKLLNTAELFHLWVIEGDFEEEFPLKKAGVNVIWTNDVTPYKKMKVRILNGAHTSLVFPSLLAGIETVGDSLKDELAKSFLDTCLSKYIMPTLGETEEHKAFASAVLERFANPYIKHLWKSISLNSVSKYTARVLPTVLDYIKANNSLPKPLVFSLACLIEYYKTCDPTDSEDAVAFIKQNDVSAILSNSTLWGENLGFMTELINDCLEKIHTLGIREAIKWAIS
ncbi:MAG: tagaturonate reductase [Oscillospiraceae bacterium]|nr:tagaturonate reductase [Oscillospiraceae bacterium]